MMAGHPAPTGASTEPLSPVTARALTQRIRAAAEHTWVLLREAHDRDAWRVLGYSGWGAYVEAEFGKSAGQSYRLIDQAVVYEALVLAAGEPVEVSARQAAVLKPDLERAAEEVGARVAAGQGTREAVRDAVSDRRPARPAQPAPPPAEPLPGVTGRPPDTDVAAAGRRLVDRIAGRRASAPEPPPPPRPPVVIPAAARPVVTRAEVVEALMGLLNLNPEDAGVHLTDSYVARLRAWTTEAVAARQGSLPGLRRHEVEPRFKKR